MYNKLIVVLMLTLAYSCQNKSSSSETNQAINKDNVATKDYSLDWLEGNWLDSSTMAFKKLSYGEKWLKQKENIYDGDQYYINKGIKGEPIKLSLINTDGVFYLTYLIGENQHTFVQDSINESYLRLIHLQDDFPSTLIYMIKDKELHITREGMANGFSRSVTFKYKNITN